MTSSATWPCAALPLADLSARTTIRVGGRAEWLLEPATPEELREAWLAALEFGVTPRVLGGGANIAIDDGVLPGVVIGTDRLRRVFRPLAAGDEAGDEHSALAPPSAMVLPDPAEDPRLVAWCGATLPSLLRAARDLGYSGLEGLVGVPGNVGGGVAMNAGGRWGEMWDVVESVRVLEPDGELRDLPRDECAPTYRNGGLGGRVVVGVVLKFRPEPRLTVAARMKDYLREKNKVQPVTERSAGCTFKNPDPELAGGRSAGELLDDVGAKALARGDAIVSPLHANFIINRGNATAADVFTLMEDMRDLVAQKTGIALEFEVKRWRPV